MKKRYTEEQIIRILREAETGKTIASICWQYGIAEATFYRRRQKYQGIAESALRRLKKLEQENSRLKKK